MSEQTLTSLIRQRAKELGFGRVKFVAAQPLEQAYEWWLAEGRHADMRYMENIVNLESMQQP